MNQFTAYTKTVSQTMRYDINLHRPVKCRHKLQPDFQRLTTNVNDCIAPFAVLWMQTHVPLEYKKREMQLLSTSDSYTFGVGIDTAFPYLCSTLPYHLHVIQ